MIVVPCEQGTPEWLAARAGIPTASCFDRIVTPSKLQRSASAKPYKHRLLAEWLLSAPLDDQPGSMWMDRGHDLEDEARRWYEFQCDAQVEQVGFCLSDDGRYGCSPDGLVGADGGLEVKCLKAELHMGYLLGDEPTDYRLQVQGCLLVTGRAWWDLLFYNPVIPCRVIRCEPDPAVQSVLADALGWFCESLAADRLKLLAMGYAPAGGA